LAVETKVLLFCGWQKLTVSIAIFSNRNQMSLFSRIAYDKLIAMTGKKGGVPMLAGEL